MKTPPGRSASARFSVVPRTVAESALLCCGFGGVLFLAVSVALGLALPGYTLPKDTISALELGSLGVVQRANFILFGASLLLFSSALRREMRGGRGERIIPALQALSGLGVIGAGVFAHPPIHLVCDLVAFNAALGVLIAFAWCVRSDPAWEFWRLYSALSAVAMMALLAAFGVSNSKGGPAGLYEKLATAVRATWTAVLVFKLLSGARITPAGTHQRRPGDAVYTATTGDR